MHKNHAENNNENNFLIGSNERTDILLFEIIKTSVRRLEVCHYFKMGQTFRPSVHSIQTPCKYKAIPIYPPVTFIRTIIELAAIRFSLSLFRSLKRTFERATECKAISMLFMG